MPKAAHTSTFLCGLCALSQVGDVYMVFEYLEYDLWALANSTEINLTSAHIRTYMKQMLDAIAYMHNNKVRHTNVGRVPQYRG